MKHVWVNRVTCSRTRSATRGALLPTDATAIPDPKSMSELPSASTSTPPPAAVMNTGRTWLTPRATLAARRASSAREAGPGISVTMRRSWGRPGPPAELCTVIPLTISQSTAGRPGAACRPGSGAGYRGAGAGAAVSPGGLLTRSRRQAVRTHQGLFAGIFGRGGVDTGDEAWLQALLDTEAALARALERAGLAEPGAGATVTAAAQAEAFDAAELGRQAALTGNPVPALVRELTRMVPPDAASAVHKGGTSQDIIDTAAMLLARQALSAIAADLSAAASAAAVLAATHRDTLMIGRTLLQQAVPVTFGLVAAGWLTSLDDG